MTAIVRPLAVGFLIVIAAACATRQTTREATLPSAWRDWADASVLAERLMTDGKVEAADSVLAAYERRWPGTPQSEQGAWWRLVHEAERADDSASTGALVTRIDSLLSAAPAAQRRVELMMLRRGATLTQQLRTERNAARAERDAVAKQRGEEMEKLRAELELVKAELERVRNRVTRRRP